MAQDQIEYTAFRGGLDLVSSSLTVAPGRAFDLHNYEPAVGGGYKRIAGYERCSGYDFSSYTTWPTAAGPGVPTYLRCRQYMTAGVSSTTGLVAGDVVVGSSSGTQDPIVYVDAVNKVIVFEAWCTLVQGETIESGTITITQGATNRVALSANDLEYITGGRDYLRSIIPVVPGSGPVRGVFFSGGGGLLYAVRDNVGLTEAKVHWGTGGAWDTMGNATIVKFDNGTDTAGWTTGTVLTGGTGGATFEVYFVGRWSGSDGTSDAAGYVAGVFLTGSSFVDNETLKIAGATKALANGASYAYVIPPGGRYESVIHNFWGEVLPRVYCVNNVGDPLMIASGGPVIPILFPTLAGAPTAGTYPKYVEVHKNHLFFGYERGSIVHTVQGDPMSVNGYLGAAEFNLGSPLTGMKSITGGGMAIYCRRKTFLLEGDDVNNWALKTIAEKSGAIDYTVQTLGQTLALDDEGLNSLERVQAYGDFKSKPLSFDVQPALTSRVSAPLIPGQIQSGVIGAFTIRGKNQYRLILEDGSGMIFYLPPNGPAEASTFEYGIVPYSLSGSVYGLDGRERVFAGDDGAGYVYELDVGYSFDGDNIYSVARFPFNHSKSPRTRKSYRQLELETEVGREDDAEYVPTFSVYAETDFGSVDNEIVSAAGAMIGMSMRWEITDDWTTYWVDPQEKPGGIALEGTGNNISIILVNDSDRTAPFKLQGMVLRYRPRRADRS